MRLNEILGDPDDAPLRDSKAGHAEQLRANSFVEQQIGTLGIIVKLDHVQQAVAGFDQERLRAAAQLANKVHSFHTI
jgi:hypothetical protein